MELLVLSEADVYRLLPMTDCIAVMSETLAALARGQAYQPLRMIVHTPDGAGLLALMPGYLSADYARSTPGTSSEGSASRQAAFGYKAVTVFPGNAQRSIDTHQGAVVLVEPDTGRLRALMHGGAITAIRTAAVSGVATDRLARPDADDLALLGSGVQARTHLAAIAAVRPLRRVRVWSRTADHARRFAEEQSRLYPFPMEAAPTAADAVRQASIVVTATSSAVPIVSGDWLAEGAHINAVGACLPTTRELDTATVASARLFVDRRESALAEAGDILIPMSEGAVSPDSIVAELGQVIIGERPGRETAAELTMFESLGLSIEDVAAAAFVVRRAVDTGAGVRVEV